MERGLPFLCTINGGGSGVASDGRIPSSALHSGHFGLLVGKTHGRLLFLRLRFATLGLELNRIPKVVYNEYA